MTVTEHIAEIENLIEAYKDFPKIVSQLQQDWRQAKRMLEIEQAVFGDNATTIAT